MQHSRLYSLLLAFFFVLGLSSTASAQSMTATDVERLQDAAADASREVTQLRAIDSSLASQLERELEGLRDETIYLKVKISKNEVVPRSDYFELRDRIDALRARARKDASSRSTTSGSGTWSPSPTASDKDVPSGTELDVRLVRGLNSATANVEDRVEATTLVDLGSGNKVTIPAGSTLRGVVNSVTKAGRLERKGSIKIGFDELIIGKTSYPVQATVVQALESEGIRGETKEIGTAAGVGAIIGGILGGFKGALAGILIGGGGMVAATEGKDVDLPAGTVLRVRLDSGLDLR